MDLTAPRTTELGTWTHDQDVPYDALIVSLYSNRSTFFEGVTAWVVVCVGATDGAHYCAPFDNEADARAFYASEVTAAEDVLSDD